MTLSRHHRASDELIARYGRRFSRKMEDFKGANIVTGCFLEKVDGKMYPKKGRKYPDHSSCSVCGPRSASQCGIDFLFVERSCRHVAP